MVCRIDLVYRIFIIFLVYIFSYHELFGGLIYRIYIYCAIAYRTGSDLLRVSVGKYCGVIYHEGYELLRALTSIYISYIIGETIYYGYRRIYIMRSYIIGGTI